jgi:hypothetical protein
MYKLLTFAGYDHAGPHIFPIEPDRERTVGHIKMARPLPPRVEHYIKTAKPIAGKTQLLIDALGAGEYYGPNSNGDHFPEEALRHDGDDYGFRTFEKYAHVFKHHINGDPARAYGDRVTLSEYDPLMHRVLLVVSIHDDKCRDILSDIANGRYPACSMGAKVPFDICSICKNKARTRAEYCPHLRYQMRKILPDGRQVCAINTLPKFFDISFVVIGAEKAAHVLKKVAHASTHESPSSAEEGERVYGKLAAQVKASATKEADIDKKVPSNLPPRADNIRPIDPAKKKRLVGLAAGAGAAKAREVQLSDGLLDHLSGYPLHELAATLTALGIPLKPEEFQRIVLVKTGQRLLADKLSRKGVVFDEYKLASSTPGWARPLEHFDAGAVNEKIAFLLRPHLKDRCCYPEPLLRRLERMEKQAGDDARDPLIYNRQWYSATDDERARASGVPGFVPAGLALAAAFLLLKRQFPQMVEKGPLALLARHPWLLPILVAGGVGASVGMQSLLRPMPLQNDVSRVDAMGVPVEAASIKTALDSAPWMRLGVIPMTYLYAGIQRQRAEHGEPLGSMDNFIASRPDLAALSSFALAPTVERGVKKILHKSAGTSPLGHELAASPWDAAIVHHIARLAQHKERKHAHVG